MLVVGDEATLKVHVHTDEPESAVALFDGAGAVTNLDVADMREQIAAREARLAAGAPGWSPSRAATACGGSSTSSAPTVVDGGDNAQPLDLRAAGGNPRGGRARR